MEHFKYGGTITFEGHFQLNKKIKIINNLLRTFSKNVPWKGNRFYNLTYSIEYHKVKLDGEDIPDPEAPHVHFILYTNKYIPGIYVRNVLSVLRDYGRSQFYLLTNLKHLQYSRYIQKDVELNNQSDRPFTQHYISQDLIPPTLEDQIDEDIIIGTDDY